MSILQQGVQSLLYHGWQLLPTRNLLSVRIFCWYLITPHPFIIVSLTLFRRAPETTPLLPGEREHDRTSTQIGCWCLVLFILFMVYHTSMFSPGGLFGPPTMDHMYWGHVEARACITYGTMEYTAQLMNLPPSWEHRVEACKATPLEIHGIPHLPKSCEDRVCDILSHCEDVQKADGVLLGPWYCGRSMGNRPTGTGLHDILGKI